LDLKHLPAKLIFSSPGGLADGSNLLVVRSPARTPGSPPVLLGGGFATHHDSVWRRPASTSWTVAGRSFLSKGKFAKIRISDYLQSQDKLVLAGETPAESEQRSCWSDWWSPVLLVAAPACHWDWPCGSIRCLQPHAKGAILGSL